MKMRRSGLNSFCLPNFYLCLRSRFVWLKLSRADVQQFAIDSTSTMRKTRMISSDHLRKKIVFLSLVHNFCLFFFCLSLSSLFAPFFLGWRLEILKQTHKWHARMSGKKVFGKSHWTKPTFFDMKTNRNGCFSLRTMIKRATAHYNGCWIFFPFSLSA